MTKQAIPRCAVIETLKTFAAKWKPCILCYLQQKPLRFSELENLIPNISRKMLSAQLRELERDSLISRKLYTHVPPKVEYALTAKGKKLMPVMEMLQNWGLEHFPNAKSIQEMLEWGASQSR